MFTFGKGLLQMLDKMSIVVEAMHYDILVSEIRPSGLREYWEEGET